MKTRAREGWRCQPQAASRALAGHGVEASVNGAMVLLSTAKLMSERGVELGRLKEEAERLAEDAKSVMYVAVGGWVARVVAVADTSKEDSRSVVAGLKPLGLEVAMITGDNRRTGGQSAVRSASTGWTPRSCPRTRRMRFASCSSKAARWAWSVTASTTRPR